MELVKIGLQELFSCFKTTSCSCKCSDSNGVVRTEWVMSTSESIPPTIDLKEVVNSKNIDKEVTETFESLDEQELMNIQNEQKQAITPIPSGLLTDETGSDTVESTQFAEFSEESIYNQLQAGVANILEEKITGEVIENRVKNVIEEYKSAHNAEIDQRIIDNSNIIIERLTSILETKINDLREELKPKTRGRKKKETAEEK